MAEEALGTLIDYRLGFVNVDQPPYASAMPPSALATSAIGYIRLHGRDPQYWQGEFSSGPQPRRSCGYLYSPAELEQWMERVQHVQANTRSTFVILANSTAGKSVVNALQLTRLAGTAPHIPTRAVA
jgi:uncharacterized protein YecE (DUF72 family)